MKRSFDMKKLRILRMLALLLALSALLTLTACSSPVPTPRAGKVVATAGGEDIYYDELYFLAMNHIEDMQKEKGEDYLRQEGAAEEIADFVWKNLLTRDHALLSVGRDYGLDITEGEIAEEVAKHLDGLITDSFVGGYDEYVETLNKQHMTDRYVRAYLAVENYLGTAIVKEMIKRGELDTSDETAEAHIYSDELIRTVHVFISNTNDRYTKEENAAHAAAIQAELAAITDDGLRYEAMRDAIGGKYNNDFSDLSGNGFYFSRGEMAAVYEKAAFALAEYGVSDVVETAEGYYVIMRMPKSEEYIESHFQEMKEKTYFITLNGMVEKRLSEMKLEKTRFGEGLDMTELPVIHANGGMWIYVSSGIVIAVLVLSGISVAFSAVLKRRKGKHGVKKA
ncbi:MAG: hypothetical protein E7644_05265 [Ruminococcaceae bacterium]|nr:hypothetical protein [Oscillospiraceae bacterium]